MKQKLDSPIVFVTGAGFTKAFDKNAPTLECDIGIKKLKKKFSANKFDRINKFLCSIITKEDKTNVEELLSRLYAGTPYDKSLFRNGERELLYEEVSENFIKLLEGIKKLENIGKKANEALKKLTEFIIENEASIITFNYDTLLEEAIFKYKGRYDSPQTEEDRKYWNPDGGYGFFLLNWVSVVKTLNNIEKDHVKSLILKLHGSINWHIKKGYQKPYAIDSLVHGESWYDQKKIESSLTETQEIKMHIENSPFIVPPVLEKSALNNEPILKLIWEQAFEKLKGAKTIVFIGYSMPQTDIAARFLFREAIKSDPKKKNIIVVDYATTKEKLKIKEVKNKYNTALPEHQIKFNFDGGEKWISANIPEQEIKLQQEKTEGNKIYGTKTRQQK